MLSSLPCLGLPNGLLCQVSPQKPCMHQAWYMSCPSHSSWFDCPNNILYQHNFKENTDPLIFTTNPPLFSSQVTKCMFDV
jgi:hypothetical protein